MENPNAVEKAQLKMSEMASTGILYMLFRERFITLKSAIDDVVKFFEDPSGLLTPRTPEEVENMFEDLYAIAEQYARDAVMYGKILEAGGVSVFPKNEEENQNG